jgi:hypothetical protein
MILLHGTMHCGGDIITVLLFLSRLRNSLWLSRILNHWICIVIRATEIFSVASDVTTRNHISKPLNCFVIRANSELQHELQLRCADIILLSHKLFLSRLSPRHTHIIN